MKANDYTKLGYYFMVPQLLFMLAGNIGSPNPILLGISLGLGILATTMFGTSIYLRLRGDK